MKGSVVSFFKKRRHVHTRRVPGLLAAGAVWLGVCASAPQCHAVLGGVVDQSYGTNFGTAFFFGITAPPSTAVVQVEQAQTFQAGISGTLMGLNLQLGRYGSQPENVTNDAIISIRTLSGGLPSLTLATANVPASAVPANPFAVTWVPVDFSSAGLTLSAGQSYAIVVTSTQVSGGATFSYDWAGGGDGTGYPSGVALGRSIGFPWGSHNAYDFGFQTLVAVPEPGTFTLLAVGAGLCALRRRR